MTRLQKLIESRKAKVAELRAILDAVEADEKRDALTEDETKKFDELEAEIRTLDEQIAREERAAKAAREQDAFEERAGEPPRPQPAKGSEGQGGAPAAHVQEDRPYSLIRAMRARLSDDPSDCKVERRASDMIAEELGRKPDGLFVPYSALLTRTERAAMFKRLREEGVEIRTVGKAAPNTTGAAVVATNLMPQEFIEVLRNATQVVRAGGRMLTNLVGDVSIPRQNAAASAGWVAENGSVAESTLTTNSLSLTPKTVGLKGTVTRRMMKQATPDIDDLVAEDIRQVIGIAVDSAAINGTGASNQPTGILNTSGIGGVTTGGGLTWAEVLEFESDLGAANALRGRLGWMTRAAIIATAKGTTKDTGSGQFLMMGSEMNGYGVFATEQVPAQTLIFGNWAEVIIAMWGGLDMFADPYSSGDAGNVVLRGFQDADIGVRHAASFSAATDI